MTFMSASEAAGASCFPIAGPMIENANDGPSPMIAPETCKTRSSANQVSLYTNDANIDPSLSVAGQQI